METYCTISSLPVIKNDDDDDQCLIKNEVNVFRSEKVTIILKANLDLYLKKREKVNIPLYFIRVLEKDFVSILFYPLKTMLYFPI